MGDFLMPSLGADMEHGKIVEWLVKPGDYVRRGDLVAVVDTDKAVMDVESFQEGVVAELLVDPGTTVPIGTPLARITPTPAEVGATGPAGAGPAAGPGHRLRLPRPPPVRAAAVQAVPRGARHPSPLRCGIWPTGSGSIRPGSTAPARAAPSRGPTWSMPWRRGRPPDACGPPRGPGGSPPSSASSCPRVSGTGPEGAVTVADVQHAAGSRTEAAAPAGSAPPREQEPEAPQPGKTPDARERVASLRRAVGALMSRSKKTIPHYYLSTTLDLRAAVEWMQSVNAQRPVASRLVPSALLLKAAALAAKDVPEVNGFYDDGGFRPSASVHLGVAVALRQGGIVAPAIHDADTLAVDVLMEQLRDLVSRARAGRLQRAEMADPTITVTNLGDLGVESVFGVIYPPQVAMLGFGRVMEQPWAQNGLLGVRPAVTATLSADHRVSDGLRGGRYLTRIDELLQKPEEL